MQSATIAKVRETFLCPFRLMVSMLSEDDGRVGHGLVLAWFKSCVLYDRQDKKNSLVSYLSLWLVSYRSLYRRAHSDNGRPSMVFGFVYSLMLIAWHYETASFTRKGERNILVPFLSMFAISS